MVFLILFLALILRLVSINQSLWLDEAIYVLAIKQQSFWGIITKFLVGDFHPPLYISLLWIWDHIFGFSEIASRLPSVVFGLLAVYLTYYLGKNWFNKKIGLLAALFLGVSPLYVYYSQEARMYSLTVCLAVLSFIFFWRFINNQRWGTVGWVITNVLILYTDYPLALLITTQVLYILIFEKRLIKKVIWPLIISGIFFSPWLIIFQKQLINGQAVAAALPNWATIVGGSSLKELALIPIKTFFGRISFENKYLYGLLILIVSLLNGYIVIQGIKKIDKKTWVLIFWVTVPVVLAFIISFFIPVLSYFRMIFILPGFYLLLARGLEREEKYFWPTLVGILLISFGSLFIYYTNPKFQREDWRGAMATVEQKAGDGGVILLESDNSFAPVDYYDEIKTQHLRGLFKVPAKSEDDIVNLNALADSKKDIYLFEYLVDVNDPGRFLQKKIAEFGYQDVETLNFNGVGLVYVYTLK